MGLLSPKTGRRRGKKLTRATGPCLTFVLFLSLLGSVAMSHALPNEEFQWLQVNGTSIVKEKGTPIILRGTNLPPLRYSWTASRAYGLMLETAKSMGFNVVRLPILWSEMEPTFGKINSRYLDLVKRIVKLAEQSEVYVVLDMHQYQFDGFPSWFMNRFTSADEAALNFWNDWTVQREFIQAWLLLASSFKEEKSIFAFDLINEPYSGPIQWQRFAAMVNDFYARLISEIRTVDPKHVLLFEPTDVCGCTSIFGNQTPLRPDASNIIFSPHVYVRGTSKHLEYYSSALYNLSATVWKIPIWVGEFGGVDVQVHDQNSMDRLSTILNLFADYKLGWAYWVLDETETGPQPVDGLGKASEFLTSLIVRAVTLVSSKILPSGNDTYNAKGSKPTDAILQIQRQVYYTFPTAIALVLLILPALIAPLIVLRFVRHGSLIRLNKSYRE